MTTKPEPTPRKPRTASDPKRKAQDALDVANRQLAKTEAKAARLSVQLADARDEAHILAAHVAYLASHPLLVGLLEPKAAS